MFNFIFGLILKRITDVLGVLQTASVSLCLAPLSFSCVAGSLENFTLREVNASASVDKIQQKRSSDCRNTVRRRPFQR